MPAILSDTWTIRNAGLPMRDGRWQITIVGNRIGEIAADSGGPCGSDFDAGGRLVSSGFVDAHVHLDKALTSDRIRDGATILRDKVQAVRNIKSDFTVQDVFERATRALEMGMAHGTTTVRSHCEADRFVGQRAVQGLQQAATALAGKVDLQIIAFPQEGWFDSPESMEAGAGPYIAEAVANGVKIVGGNVNRKLWPSSPEQQVDETFALAAQHDCDIDYHLDNWDGADAFTLPYVARKTIEQGWQGRVAVAHIASLPWVSDGEASDAIELVKQADISVCVLPTRMRLTRVNELMEAGVNVVCGTDNLRDPFVRYGDADPLKALLLLAQITRQLDNAGLDRLWRTMTANAARMLRLKDYGLEPGCFADLVLFDALSVSETILLQAPKLAVVKNGVQVAGPLALRSAA